LAVKFTVPGSVPPPSGLTLSGETVRSDPPPSRKYRLPRLVQWTEWARIPRFVSRLWLPPSVDATHRSPPDVNATDLPSFEIVTFAAG